MLLFLGFGMVSNMSSVSIPKEFIWRRLHSLMGLWLVLFLLEHLLVNSQAALLLGDNGRGFVEMVNSIHNLPYLPVIEFFLLGVPILIHMVWGIKYLLTAKSNSWPGKSKPSLPEYGRNQAYTWQRITSWILVFGLIGHIINFRFLEYPLSLNQGASSSYFVCITVDKGLYTVANRLGITLYDQKAILEESKSLQKRGNEMALVEVAKSFPERSNYSSHADVILTSAQKLQQKLDFVNMLQKKPLHDNEVIAVTDNFGTASLLTVRDTFKSPLYVGLYTVFVLAACFHAFNGLWTFLITWGVVLKMSSQRGTAKLAIGLMLLVAFLGLAAIWGTYWINLSS
jgi:succinate dehydrogenase / fumarate reductase cytochrome b subunit